MGKSTGGATGLWQGKVGGFNYRIVNGKQVISEFVIPHNPQTARQTEIRLINTENSRAYRDDLNQGQRNAWDQRAKQLNTKGNLLFIKQNFPLVDFGLAKQLTPPPMIMPPELFDLVILVTDEEFELKYDQLSPAIITAQTPFLDIEIAGGFTMVEQFIDPPVDPTIATQVWTEALSQGRIHQDSDFRHAIYAQDQPIPAVPEDNIILGTIPDNTIRNVVFRVRRYNKYGNFSEVKVLNAIITAPTT